MSSPGSETLRLELPRILLSEAAAAALCLAGALTTGLVLGRHPGLPAAAGAGILAGVATAAWLYLAALRPARALRRVVWLPDDTWQLEFRDGSVVTARLAPGTRMLGRSLALHWRLGDRRLMRWLTPWDVDEGRLRALTVRLACAAHLRTC
jgi:hypothetical protein